MPGTMIEADLVLDLKASLQDAASVFFAGPDADFRRHLGVAALDFVRSLDHRCTGKDALDFMYRVFPEGVTPDNDRIADAHAPEVAAMLRELA